MKSIYNPTADELEQNPSMYDEAPVIGKYGFMFQEYLKSNHPGRVTELALATTLWDICAEVNAESLEMLSTLQEQLRAQNPRLRKDFNAILQYELWLQSTAEEIVLNEIVYKYR